jgi:hypothetical protein
MIQRLFSNGNVFPLKKKLGLIDSSRKLLLICADIYAISLHLVLHVFEGTLM